MIASTRGSSPASDRVRLRRGATLGRYGREDVVEVLDAGLVAHLGVAIDDGAVVIPMAYGHDGESLFLHGAAGNAALRAAVGREACATVTVVDGLLVGRSPFHNSMRYRSAVVRGTVSLVDDEARVRALQLISDHVVETWSTGRLPIAAELRRTLVVSIPLTESSAKVRGGDPTDEPGDVETDYWAGAVPLVARWGDLQPASNLRPGIEPPDAVAALAGEEVSSAL